VPAAGSDWFGVEKFIDVSGKMRGEWQNAWQNALHGKTAWQIA
jgi:hypothetical protein